MLFFLPSIFSMLVTVICYLVLVNLNVGASLFIFMIHCFHAHMSFCVELLCLSDFGNIMFHSFVF